jgi:hypothetical protein
LDADYDDAIEDNVVGHVWIPETDPFDEAHGHYDEDPYDLAGNDTTGWSQMRQEMLECEDRERRFGEYNPYGDLTYNEWCDIQRATNSAMSPIVVTPDGFAFVTQATPRYRQLVHAPTLVELLASTDAAASSSTGVAAGSVILPVPSPELTYYSDSSSEDFCQDYTDDAAVVSIGQEAVERIVWTRLADGRLLRTRYDLRGSGLSESTVDAAVASYYAAPLRLIDGVWYPVRNGVVQRD